MPDDEAGKMNLRAYMALGGASLDWRTDLVRLLRSNIPLNRLLRDRLATLIDNVTDDGPRLNLAGHKEAQNRFDGVATRSEWMEIGRWVTTHAYGKTTTKSAVQAAADYFGEGIKKVEAAVTYYNKAMIWVDQAMSSDAGKAMGREWMERLFHSITVNPEMRQINSDLLRELGLSH